jgi:hypothetical protein
VSLVIESVLCVAKRAAWYRKGREEKRAICGAVMILSDDPYRFNGLTSDQTCVHQIAQHSIGKRVNISWRNQESVNFMMQRVRNSAYISAYRRQPPCHRLKKRIRKSFRIRGEDKHIRLVKCSDYLPRRFPTGNYDLSRPTAPLYSCLDRLFKSAASDKGKTESVFSSHASNGIEQFKNAFLLHQPTDKNEVKQLSFNVRLGRTTHLDGFWQPVSNNCYPL